MSRALALSLGAALIGSLAVTLGAFVDPRRVAFAYLTACTFALTLALGALFWVMIAHVTGAFWIVPMRRIAENISLALVPLGLIVVPLSFAAPLLFPWARNPEQPIPEHLEGYYTTWGFVLRTAASFAVFVVLALLLRRHSRAQEKHADAARARSQETISGVGLPLFALAISMFSFDWLMPLDPEWRSTMYGVYVFAGSALAGLALIVLVARLAVRGDRLAETGAAHAFSSGKLLLTFTMFWAYIGFGQFLIVWSADIPIESAWYQRRGAGGWAVVSGALVVGHFALPFAILLSNRFKKSLRRVAWLGIWLLVLHYLDVYWLVLPGLHASGPAPHWLDLAALLQVLGVCAACVLLWSRRDALMPENDPRLPEALALTPVEP